MVKAVLWLLCLYLILKLVQFFFAGRAGYARTEQTVREKLLRGEPVLFLVAFAISVPAALWSSWYFQRGYESGFARSTDCYGRLGALRSLPIVYRRHDSLEVYKSAQLARSVALQTGKWLERNPRSVDQALSNKLRFYSERYSALSRGADSHAPGDDVRAVDTCMRNPFILL